MDKKRFFYTRAIPIIVSLLLGVLIIFGAQVQNSPLNNWLQNHAHLTQNVPIETNVTTVIVTLILAFLLPFLRIYWQVLSMVVLGIIVIGVNQWFAHSMNMISPVALPLLAALLLTIFTSCYRYVTERYRRKKLENFFKQYVPPTTINAMLKSDKNYSLSSETKEMSVLFADIRNFTEISEGMAVGDLKIMLNTFFNELSKAIFAHHGTIDKYIGDMVMAFWGAPLDDTNHASHALATAFKLQEINKDLSQEFLQKNLPLINIGVGINTGMMMVGDMGSSFKPSYTVLGDAVNVASRVESLTKYYRVGIVVTQATANGQDDILFRRLDKIIVKGKHHPIIIYEPVCYRASLDEPALNLLVEEMSYLQRAMEYYEVQQWDKSIAIFDILHAHHPQVHLYSIYLERLRFLRGKLIENWNGVYSFTEK